MTTWNSSTLLKTKDGGFGTTTEWISWSVTSGNGLQTAGGTPSVRPGRHQPARHGQLPLAACQSLRPLRQKMVLQGTLARRASSQTKCPLGRCCCLPTSRYLPAYSNSTLGKHGTEFSRKAQRWRWYRTMVISSPRNASRLARGWIGWLAHCRVSIRPAKTAR